MKYSNEQIECLRENYPDSNYDEILKMFPDKNKREIGEIARYYGIKSNNPGHLMDLTGQRFGRLLVECIDHKFNGVVYWKCKCECGNEKVVKTTLLRSGKTKSCGCLARESVRGPRVDHTGERFGMLVAIERYPRYKGGRTYYLCRCDCKNEKMVSGSSLVSGRVLSCGCISNNRKRQWELKNPDIPYDFRKYIVYKHTSPNSKVYIGVTMQEPSKRWQNGLGYETQTYFYRAIKKYGWESFEHEILESDLSMKEALSKEKEYISLYDSRNPEHGYNILEGGQGGRFIVNPVIQYYYDQEVNFFESLAHAAEEMGVSEGTIRNYINSEDLPDGYRFEMLPSMSKYEIDPTYYKVKDESHYHITTLMKNRKREKTIQRNLKSRRAVNQYKLDGTYIKTWGSIKEAVESLPGMGSLSSSLRNDTNSKTAGGFQWRYDDGDHQNISPVELKNRRPVVQINGDTGKIINYFASAAEASRATGVGNKQIYKSCKGICIRAGGFVWKYAE